MVLGNQSIIKREHAVAPSLSHDSAVILALYYFLSNFIFGGRCKAKYSSTILFLTAGARGNNRAGVGNYRAGV